MQTNGFVKSKNPIKNKDLARHIPKVEMAARAHDVAAIALRGCFACLNFADSAWRLPISTSSKCKDIQKAVAKAAEAFRRPLNYYSESVSRGGYTPEMPKSMFYVDEEALFYMPGLLENLEIEDHHAEADAEMSLWNYSG